MSSRTRSASVTFASRNRSISCSSCSTDGTPSTKSATRLRSATGLRRVSEAEVEAFARQLVSAGLVHSGSQESGRQLYQRRRSRQQQRPWNALSNILALRIPLFQPDRLLDRLLPWFGWLFTPGAAFAAAMVVFGALLLVATHFDVFRARLPSCRGSSASAAGAARGSPLAW